MVKARSKSGRGRDELGSDGRAFYDAVQAEFAIEDSGGVSILLQACHMLDRAAECRSQVAKEGQTFSTNTGLVRAHPLLAAEAAARAGHIRAVQALGISLEPLKQMGRPSDSSRLFARQQWKEDA